LDKVSMASRAKLFLGWGLACVAAVGLLLASAAGQEESGGNQIAREDVDACMACHASEINGSAPVSLAALNASPHKDLKCQDCHFSITAAPHTPQMLQEKAACGTCHSKEQKAYLQSTHAKPDRVAGDHPRCVSCHAQEGDPHAVTAASAWNRREKMLLCTQCHAQTDRMNRYGVDIDAVHSYNESFHGKALLRFGMTKVAICNDCHRSHDVLSPEDPRAPIHRNNAARTCSQSGCHAGAKLNFAMSGANHLRLKVKEEPVLTGILWFFRLLVFGMTAFLLGGVALDLRKKVFSTGPPPRCGRPVAALVGLSFLLLVAAIVMATLYLQGAKWVGAAAIVVMALAYVVYFLQRLTRGKPAPTQPPERLYQRMAISIRWQHALLLISITLLILTGMPLRFAQVEWLKSIYFLFGGLAGARIVHRVAAVVLMGTSAWHIVYLLIRWHKAGWKSEALTMWPTRKDIADFITLSKNYLGLSKEEPKYGRYSFKQKMDYLAEYWGVPIMVLSGLVLWFPIYFGNRLPELAISTAIIAHGYEATLAFLAIVSWHLYNVIFSPDVFPMRLTWLTGTMTRSEMEREHPLELEQWDMLEAGHQVSEGPAEAKEQRHADTDTLQPSGQAEEVEQPPEEDNGNPPAPPP
jgi:cytochrome b subunit of formate dehydrogenase